MKKAEISLHDIIPSEASKQDFYQACGNIKLADLHPQMRANLEKMHYNKNNKQNTQNTEIYWKGV